MKVGKLNNGLRYVLAPHSGELIVALIIFGVGGRNEPAEYAGISHLLEHMIFKGSKEYPDYLKVFGEFDAMGAEFNAYTSNDQTGYFVKFYKAHLKKVLKALANIVEEPLLNTDELKKEKEVVYEEINSVQDNPNVLAASQFEDTVFKGHPLSNSVDGTKKTVGSISVDELRKFHDKWYCPSNTIVVLVGDIPQNTLKLVEKYFAWPDRKCGQYTNKKYVDKKKRPLIVVKNIKSDQEHLVLGFPFFGYYDSRRYAVEVLNVIVGTTFTSRLFVEAREKKGLVYTIKSHVRFFEEGGYFAIVALTEKRKLFKVLKVIFEVLDEVKRVKVPEKELRKAKTNLEGVGYIEETDILNLAKFYGVQILYSERSERTDDLREQVMTYKQYIKKIMKVTAIEVLDVAKEIFVDKKMVISLVGETKDDKVKKMVSDLYL